MSSPNDIGDLINKNANSRTLQPSAVVTQVALMTFVSIVTILAFNVLRPKNKIIYEPKVKYHVGNKQPPRISDSLFGWIPPLINTKEPELVDKIGLDAVAFLRFLRMFRYLFSCIAIVTCGVLIPINVTYTIKNSSSKNDYDILSMLTIRDVNGQFLFAHVAVSYIITGLVMFFVYINWVQMVKLRHEWVRSPEYAQSFYARTLTILHVPKNFQSDEGLRAIFESTKVPYPTTAVHIGRKVGKLPELIEYHNTTVRELEQVLVRYLKGGKIAKERPTIRIGGWLGMGGKKRDAIDFYTAKLKRTESAIEQYRDQIDARKAENYGFASMAAVPYAHIVASMLRHKHPKGTDIALAPNPKDIIWENMDKTDVQIFRKRTIGFFYLALVCFFNTAPLFVLSVLANLNSLQFFVPFIQTWANASPISFAVVSGVLPPAVSGFFSFFMPIIVRWLSQYQGALTQSRLDRAVVGRYFAFLVLSQLVVFTLIGVIFNSVRNLIIEANQHESIKQIWEHLHTLPQNINTTYIDQSSYWLTYFPLRGFLVFFDLAQVLNLLWTSLKTRLFGRTPRDIREWTKPADFEYAVYYTNILFMGTVAMVFAPLAPLVVLAGALVFWMSSWVYKYQLMFVFTSKVESGGRLWNVMVNRLLVSVVLMQMLMILTIGLQYSDGFKSFFWVSTLPPILIILIFKIYIKRKFTNTFRYYMPTEDELRQVKLHSERADNKGHRLEKRFGHPALQSDLFTPMLHAKMMPLLADVYKGRIASDHALLNEYGGQKMEAQVVEGGVRFAAVDQRDLEYDPTLYQRDRGELDWDQRSFGATTMLGADASSIGPSKSMFYADPSGRGSPAPTYGRGSPAPSAYDRYASRGPTHHPGASSEIELSRIETNADQLPLLMSQQGYFDGAPPRPISSQYYHQQDPRGGDVAPPGVMQPPQGQYPPAPPTYRNEGNAYREAPVHRPYPHPPNRQQSNLSLQSWPAPSSYPVPHSRSPSAYSALQGADAQNMAGRGTYRQ